MPWSCTADVLGKNLLQSISLAEQSWEQKATGGVGAASPCQVVPCLTCHLGRGRQENTPGCGGASLSLQLCGAARVSGKAAVRAGFTVSQAWCGTHFLQWAGGLLVLAQQQGRVRTGGSLWVLWVQLNIERFFCGVSEPEGQELSVSCLRSFRPLGSAEGQTPLLAPAGGLGKHICQGQVLTTDPPVSAAL